MEGRGQHGLDRERIPRAGSQQVVQGDPVGRGDGSGRVGQGADVGGVGAAGQGADQAAELLVLPDGSRGREDAPRVVGEQREGAEQGQAGEARPPRRSGAPAEGVDPQRAGKDQPGPEADEDVVGGARVQRALERGEDREGQLERQGVRRLPPVRPPAAHEPHGRRDEQDDVPAPEVRQQADQGAGVEPAPVPRHVPGVEVKPGAEERRAGEDVERRPQQQQGGPVPPRAPPAVAPREVQRPAEREEGAVLLEPERRDEHEQAGPVPGARAVAADQPGAQQRGEDHQGVGVRHVQVRVHGVVGRGEQPGRHEPPPAGAGPPGDGDVHDQGRPERAEDGQQPQGEQARPEESDQGKDGVVVERVVGERHEPGSCGGVDRLVVQGAQDVLEHGGFHQLQREGAARVRVPEERHEQEVPGRDRGEQPGEQALEVEPASRRRRLEGGQENRHAHQGQREPDVEWMHSALLRRARRSPATRRSPQRGAPWSPVGSLRIPGRGANPAGVGYRGPRSRSRPPVRRGRRAAGRSGAPPESGLGRLAHPADDGIECAWVPRDIARAAACAPALVACVVREPFARTEGVRRPRCLAPDPQPGDRS